MRRIYVAALIAPPVAVLTLWLLVVAAMARETPLSFEWDSVGYSLFWFALFGLPTAYFVSYVAAVPVYVFLRNRGLLRRRTVVPSASLIGAIATPVVMWTVVGRPTGLESGFAVLFGLLAGFVAGFVFWVVGLSSREGQSAA